MQFILEGEEEKSWSKSMYEDFGDASPNLGVTMKDVFLLSSTKYPVVPCFTDLTFGSIRCHFDDARIPTEYIGSFHFHAPVQQMEKYFPHFQERVESLDDPMFLTATLNESADKTMWILIITFPTILQ